MPQTTQPLELQPAPAEYLSGEALAAQQETNRNILGASPDQPYLYGEFLAEDTQRLTSIQDSVQRLQELGVDTSVANSQGGSPDSILESAHQNVAHWLAEARADLSGNGFSGLTALDDESLKEQLVANHEQFLQAAEGRRSELLAAKERFVARMHQAIERGGLPLTHEQLEQRLASVTIGFKSVFDDPTSAGRYKVNRHRILVVLHETGKDLEHTVWHELLHAVSGKRVTADKDSKFGLENRRIGLMQPNGRRRWWNEAVTDMLADILLDEQWTKFDFGSEERPLSRGSGLSNVYGVWARVLESQERELSYDEFKQTAAQIMVRIPAKSLLRAYFAEDRDPLEADRLAGTHAERDLQRTIKVAGGAKRIVQLRVIDRAFAAKDNKSAEKQAKKIQRYDYSNRSLVGRAVNRRRVAQHTEDYQRRIKRAKQHAQT